MILRKSGSLVVVWIKSLATVARCSFCSGSRAAEQIFPWYVSCQHPASKSQTQQFLESPDQLLVLTLSVTIFVGCSPSMFNILRCSACCRPSRTWITFNIFSTIFEVFVPQFYLCRTHCMIPKSFLNHLNTFHAGMSKLNAEFDADLLFCSLSHFECAGHTVHRLTQWHPLPPLTSTVKSSLFTHGHSSPLSVSVRLHRTNCSCYIKNGWTFSGQISCKYVNIYVSFFYVLF